jgi:D-amino peptidase
MRVYISVDMEGVAGVATLDQIVRGGNGYARAQELMTDEANAAIRGAFTGGATEVVVSDSHGTMDNLLHERLDERARLVFGAPRAACMVHGLQAGDAAALFVGYHAGAGAPGVLAHTFSSNFTEVRLNGEPVTEAEVNGLYAAALGVPVGLVTGDDEICSVAGKAFPSVTTVAVKRAMGFSTAESDGPEIARDRIERAAREVVEKAAELSASVVPDRLVVAADFATPLAADFAATLPRSRRLSGRTLEAEPADAGELIATLMSWYYLSAHGAAQMATVATRR